MRPEEVGGEGAEHILGAMCQVDHPQQSENHRQPQAQHRVERAVYQPDQQLAERRLSRDMDHDQRACSEAEPSIEPVLLIVEFSGRQDRLDAAVLHEVEAAGDLPGEVEILLDQ